MSEASTPGSFTAIENIAPRYNRLKPDVTLQMRFVLRALTIIVTGISLLLGPTTAIVAADTYRIGQIVPRTLRGDTITLYSLKAAVSDAAEVSDFCAAATASKFIIARLSLLENVRLQSKEEEAIFEAGQLASDNHRALTCEPTQSFQWLLQSWIAEMTRDVDSSTWQSLAMSYETGRYEGWIAVRRSRIALADFDAAPERLRDSMIREFKVLLDFNFFDDGVHLYESASAAGKERLDEAVAALGISKQQSFKRHLDELMPTEPLFETVVGKNSIRQSNGKSRP